MENNKYELKTWDMGKINIKKLYYDPVDYDVESELNNIIIECKICNLRLHVESFTYKMIDAHRFDYKFDEATRTLEFICKWCMDPSHNNDSNIIKFHGIYNRTFAPGELTRKIRKARKELNKVEALYNDERKRMLHDDAIGMYRTRRDFDFMDPEVDEDA